MLDKFLEVAYTKSKEAEAKESLVSALEKLPDEYLHKLASGEEKLAYHGDDCEWLEKFKGTPLFQQAYDLEKSDLQLRMQEKDFRKEESQLRDERIDSVDSLRDELCVQRKMLDLELVALEEGIDSGSESEPELEAQEPDAEVSGTEVSGTEGPDAEAVGGFEPDEGKEAAFKLAYAKLKMAKGKTAARVVNQQTGEVLYDTGPQDQQLMEHMKDIRRDAGAARGATLGSLVGAGAGALSGIRNPSRIAKRAILGGLGTGTLGGTAGGFMGSEAGTADARGIIGLRNRALLSSLEANQLRNQLSQYAGKEASAIQKAKGIKRVGQLLSGSRAKALAKRTEDIGSSMQRSAKGRDPMRALTDLSKKTPAALRSSRATTSEARKVLGTRAGVGAGAAGLGAAAAAMKGKKKEAAQGPGHPAYLGNQMDEGEAKGRSLGSALGGVGGFFAGIPLGGHLGQKAADRIAGPSPMQEVVGRIRRGQGAASAKGIAGRHAAGLLAAIPVAAATLYGASALGHGLGGAAGGSLGRTHGANESIHSHRVATDPEYRSLIEEEDGPDAVLEALGKKKSKEASAVQKAKGIKRVGQLLSGSRAKALDKRLGNSMTSWRRGVRSIRSNPVKSMEQTKRTQPAMDRAARATLGEATKVLGTRAGVGAAGAGAAGMALKGGGNKEAMAKEAFSAALAKGLLGGAGKALKGAGGTLAQGAKQTGKAFQRGGLGSAARTAGRQGLVFAGKHPGVAAGAAGLGAGAALS